MCEIALVSSKPSRLSDRASKGQKGATKALELLEEPERFLSSMQVGITLVGIVAGAYGGATLSAQLKPFVAQFDMLAPYADNIAFIVVISIITYLSIVLGELVPKTISMRNPEAIAVAVSPFVSVFTKFSSPVVWFLSFSTKIVLKLLFIDTSANENISEDELKTMIKLANQQGVIETKESELMHNIFKFADRKAYSLMTHRTDVEWIDINLSKEEINKQIFESNFNKFPVCDGNFENVLGILMLNDYLANYSKSNFSIKKHLSKPIFLPENLSAIKILELFRKRKDYFGFVVDEYGSMEGIITLHDLAENIFGYLPDLEDERELPTIVVRADGSLLVDGSVTIDELNNHLVFDDFNESDLSYNTLAGFVLLALKKIPETGDYFDSGNYRFEVVDMDKSKIDKVLIMQVNQDNTANQ